MYSNLDLLKQHEQNYASVFGTPQLAVIQGKGDYLIDADKKRYIDFLGGIAVNCLGHSNKELSKTMSKQSKKLWHTSNFFTTKEQLELTSNLLKISKAPNGSKVFITNSGTESLECALKIVKKHSQTKSKNAKILALTSSFHGRSLGALSITSKGIYREPFSPLLPNIEFIERDNIQELEKAFKNDIAGLFIEIIQGEAGVKPLSKDFIQKARELTTKNNALLVVDEVQTGMGRCGQWFSFQNNNLVNKDFRPDIITLAKSLGGGFPIGAVVTFNNWNDEKKIGLNTAEILTPGNHGTTFGGNPLACSIANKVIEVIQNKDLLKRNRDNFEFIEESIKSQYIKEIRGQGMLIAIELIEEKASDVQKLCLKKGLIVNNVNPNSIRIAPSYLIKRKTLKKGLDILNYCINEVFKK